MERFVRKKEFVDSQMYLWLGDYLNIISPNQAEVISPKSVFAKTFIILKEVIKDFLLLFKVNTFVHNLDVSFIETVNNYESLKFLKNQTKFVSPWKIEGIRSDAEYDILLPKFKFLHDLEFVFFFIWLMVISDKSSASNYLSRLEMIFKSYGIVDEYVRIFYNNKPRKIVFTNDHNIYSRGVLLAAKISDIKTVYIQHASVSKYFPPLEYDLSLLEGEDSKSKYLSISDTKSVIELVGIPKFDKYSRNINANTTVNKLGICYNLNDRIEDVLHIADKISAEFPYLYLVLRGHPNDTRLQSHESYSVSASKTENSFSFLSNVDMIVSGDSSIHVEAVMLNVVSVYHNFSKNIGMNDYYGFVKNGLAISCESFDELQSVIDAEQLSKSDVQYKAKFYNEAVGTDFFGKSELKALQFIKSI